MQNIPLSSHYRKRKNTLQNTIFLVVFLGVFLGAVGFLGFQNFRIYQKRAELSQRADELRAQVSALQERKYNLEIGIEEAQTEEYQEKVLREQGLYKKPGEEVITILPPEDSQSQNNQEQKRIWWNPTTWFK